MSENLVVQGRVVGPPDLALIRHWLDQNPGWSRWRLSQVLATHWDWRNGVGQLKDLSLIHIFSNYAAGSIRRSMRNALEA